jgi:hypothetical protein
MTEPTNRSEPTTATRTPAWWTAKHTDAWDRVKEAFQRDWAQTRADFSHEPTLNQNVGDTVKQAMGDAPIPPMSAKTHATDPKVTTKITAKAKEHLVDATKKVDARTVAANETIAEERQALSEKVADIRDDMARDAAKGRDRIADAVRATADDIHTQRARVADAAKKRDDAAAAWRHAEQEAAYGYSVRTQRPDEVWNDHLETSLRDEWTWIGNGRPWDDARHGVRSGWEYARGTR